MNPQNGNDYHVLDVSAVIVNHSNGQAPIKTVSYLRFAGHAYAFNITGYNNQSLAGDVMTLPPRGMNKTSFTPTLVGNIKLSKSPKEGVLFSTGSLTMNGTNYNVVLSFPIMTWGAAGTTSMALARAALPGYMDGTILNDKHYIFILRPIK